MSELSSKEKPDVWQRKAQELVDGNATRYPGLLVEQLASAMRGEAEAVAQAYRVRTLAAVCLRLVERAGVKPKGDEIEAMRLAEEFAFLHPARRGGDGWLEPDQLRIDLQEGRLADAA